MITPEIRQAILALHHKKTAVRKIARLLKISRNTVRQAIRQPSAREAQQPQMPQYLQAPIQAAFVRCEGNVVRVQEVLEADHKITIPYSTLTRWVREADWRAPKQRSGRYHFAMGEEMQFDTSPHRLALDDHPPPWCWPIPGASSCATFPVLPASRPRPFYMKPCASWMAAQVAA